MMRQKGEKSRTCWAVLEMDRIVVSIMPTKRDCYDFISDYCDYSGYADSKHLKIRRCVVVWDGTS